jgi:LPS export ABC transporter protein LptC
MFPFRKRIFRFSRFFALVGLAWFIVGCNGTNSLPPSTAITKEFPDQESWNLVTRFTKEGVLNAIVEEGHMVKYGKRNMTFLSDHVKVDFYDEKGQHTTLLNSDSAILYSATNDMEAIGHVVVVSDSGMTLETERLRWDYNRQKIVSDDFVTIITPSEILYGQGFESDRNLENYEIKRVRGQSEKRIGIKFGTKKHTSSTDTTRTK